MENHPLEILSFKILEPGTFISDLLMAAASYYFFVSLKKIASERYQNHFANFFLFMFFSSLMGGFAHSLFLYTGKSLHYISWLLTGISVFFMELAFSVYIIGDKSRSIYLVFVKFKLLIFFLLTSVLMNFAVVKVNTAVGLIGIVFPILLFQIIKFRNKSNIYILSGIFLAIIPAFIHTTKFQFAGIFNMNDFSHFFLIICMFLMFKGLRFNILNGQGNLDKEYSVKLNT